MNKSWFYLGAIGSLATLITSCGGDGGKPATPAASPSAAASPAAAPAPVAAVPPKAAPATLATAPKPVVAATAPIVPATSTAKKSVSVDVAAGLIPPTDGESWAKTVAKGRPDPFASLALQPIEVAEKEPLDGTGKPQRSSSKIASKNLPAVKSGVDKPLPSIKTGTKIASIGKNGEARSATSDSVYVPISAIPKSGINKTLPKIVVALSTAKTEKATAISKAVPNTGGIKPSLKITALPAARPAQSNISKETTQIASKSEKVAEKPLQAMAIEVSGVMEVAGKTQVIVKLPNESFSRYIEVGDRVANGKVLIKRVEGQQSLSPTVVLEEVGVEVPRKIGDKAATAAPADQSKP
jgi:hypothetical protein